MRTNKSIINRKQKWEEKQLHIRFKRLISGISHKKTLMWLRKGNLKRETESLLIAIQNNVLRTNRFTQNDTKKISNRKTPGHDGIYGFWFKKFTSIHDRLSLEMNGCLQGAHVPEWMTKGKTALIQKEPSKGTAPNNYKPVTCLPMMWKILTAQMRKEIYYSLTSRRLFPGKQKGCRKWSRGTAELLYIDQHILNERKTRRKNLSMAWIDHKNMIWSRKAE